jgi:hypothetical protein
MFMRKQRHPSGGRPLNGGDSVVVNAVAGNSGESAH